MVLGVHRVSFNLGYDLPFRLIPRLFGNGDIFKLLYRLGFLGDGSVNTSAHISSITKNRLFWTVFDSCNNLWCLKRTHNYITVLVVQLGVPVA